MGLLTFFKNLFKREAPDAAIDEAESQQSKKKQKVNKTVDELEYTSDDEDDVEDEAYDPLVISKKDAKVLEQLGVTSLPVRPRAQHDEFRKDVTTVH